MFFSNRKLILTVAVIAMALFVSTEAKSTDKSHSKEVVALEMVDHSHMSCCGNHSPSHCAETSEEREALTAQFGCTDFRIMSPY